MPPGSHQGPAEASSRPTQAVLGGITFAASLPPGVKKGTPVPEHIPLSTTGAAPPPVKRSASNAHGVTVVVEPSTEVADNDETFVTQKGGKIVQNPQVTLQNERMPSMFESRRTLQSTLLLQKKKEMQAVQLELEKRRLEFAKRMSGCKDRQEELRSKQKQIRDRVNKFERFLKENDAKRQRANLKAQTEKKSREQKEHELLGLLKQLNLEQIKHGSVLHLIKKYEIYEAYLQSVVDVLPPEYLDVNEPHINDILMRHKTLVETNDDLRQAVQKSQDEIESEQTRLGELVKEKNDLILVQNSTLGTQQKRLDQLKQECAYLEQRLEERDNTGKERMRMLSETKLAINNIYDRIGLRPHAALETPPAQVVITPPGAARGPDTLVQQQQQQHGGFGAALVPPPPPAFLSKDYVDNSAKALGERLHAIQDRVLDLGHIAQRTEQAILGQDHAVKGKKQPAGTPSPMMASISQPAEASAIKTH
ncbi:uncharacterized protein EV422DRAFT_563890 [Fimicolochytrium jonesii]|uniref:uncharacterized protein n=1 Tax=Fimicolochytrium jonesii TaxID=1396493 RepID=UPI0022FE3FDC|nr:uncharacterized protein EV422DRAFT_563890 [Fimicolochytrium jonesii]KAI8826081.1 hypothetical protein EV422DRAFT_563890 [Fimicolochytrium jonesii]